MFKSLLKIAIRNLRKDRFYTTINIVGLTISLTSILFIVLYVFNELSYDRYNKNAENIYRVITNIKEPDNSFTWAVAQIPMAEELRNNYSEIINAVRFFKTGRILLRNGDRKFYEDKFYLADSTVFDMFSYEFIQGDRETALDYPFSLVITESAARKYFDDNANVLDQSLQNIYGQEFKITGVIKDIPLNSHFRFDGLISRNTTQEMKGDWQSFGVYTYIQLPPKQDLSTIQGYLDKIAKEKAAPKVAHLGMEVKYQLQKLTDIHLYSKIQDEAEEGGDITYVYIFSSVGLFILIIACINYMNLATAQSINRSKEVGVRKVVGAVRPQLIMQFIIESVVITLIALVISLLLVAIFLPAFNNLSNETLEFFSIFKLPVFASVFGILVFTGIVGGSYPALYLSRFNPIQVLKGKPVSRGGGVLFRKLLVVIQFCISVFMLIATLLVFEQLQYLRSKDLGFDKERIIRINTGFLEIQNNVQGYVNRLEQFPEIIGVGSASSSPGKTIAKLLFKVEDNKGAMSDRGVDLFVTDFGFIKAMGMEIVTGRNFSNAIPSDSTSSVIVNQSMVHRMSWDDPIGKKIVLPGAGPNGSDIEKKVVGVIKDYNQNSLYDAIEPLMLVLGFSTNYLFVRTQGDPDLYLSLIQKEWKEFYPNTSFDYTFLDQDFNSQYKADERRSELFTMLSALTIIVACLGLFGLVVLTTQQRSKEIAVRKINGANTQSLIVLISKDFLILVAIGCALAFPLAWYFTENWLQSFAYRIELINQWWIFIISSLIALFITMITLSFYIARAASANPVKSLRDE